MRIDPFTYRKNKIILNDSCCLHFAILYIITQEAALYLCNGKPIDFYLILLTNEDNVFIILLIIWCVYSLKELKDILLIIFNGIFDM